MQTFKTQNTYTMWKFLSTAAAVLLLLFLVNKLIDRWMDAPKIDFNKQYDKTML